MLVFYRQLVFDVSRVVNQRVAHVARIYICLDKGVVHEYDNHVCLRQLTSICWQERVFSREQIETTLLTYLPLRQCHEYNNHLCPACSAAPDAAATASAIGLCYNNLLQRTPTAAALARNRAEWLFLYTSTYINSNSLRYPFDETVVPRCAPKEFCPLFYHQFFLKSLHHCSRIQQIMVANYSSWALLRINWSDLFSRLKKRLQMSFQ